MSRTFYHALSWIVLGYLTAVCGAPAAMGQAPGREQAMRLNLNKAEVSDQDDDESRLLKERYNAALDEWESFHGLAEIGQISPADPQLHDCLQRLVSAGLDLHRRPAERIKLLEEYVRMATLSEKTTEAAADAGRASTQENHRARYFRANAELMLLRERKKA